MQLNSLLCFRSVGRYLLVTVFFCCIVSKSYLTAPVFTFPLNLPLTFGLPPSHLGIACKQPLRSVWRRLEKGDLVLLRRRNSLLCFRSVGRYLLVTVFFCCIVSKSYLTAPVFTFPLNLPLTFGLPPSHLGIACKQPLRSVWRRLKKGDLSLRSH